MKNIKTLRNQISSQIEKSKKATYKTKIEKGKDDPKSIWKTFKEFGASNKKVSNNDILGLKINGDIIADHSDLAEKFNDYFINIAAKLKESIKYDNFRKIQDYINSHIIPKSVQFERPEIGEHFINSFCLLLTHPKQQG